MEKYLNTLLCGFRKAHSTQNALFILLQPWQEELDKSGYVGTILMRLSKAYDCLPHDLLVAKFEGYIICSCQNDRKVILEDLKYDIVFLLR